MNTPRIGDSLISKQMKPFVVVAVELGQVFAEPEKGGAERRFELARLEEIEPGLYQEYPR